MIGNAHLDPVWLWHWQRGADEAVATCRAACDLLDDYPDVVFTRGEAWVYEQVRLLDPGLLKRIRAHIKAGRWDVVGGWWVQPDVNLPTEEAILHSASLGHAWFHEHLGVNEIPVGYNVDSFGQGAFLPRMLRRSGQKYYVMLRPGEHERALASCLFRWRSPDHSEVLTFRIVGGYGHGGPDLSGHIQAAVSQAPRGVGHVMCFYGVGNHGGGPTRATVEWIRAHRNFTPGVRLEFSSPTRFFRAVDDCRDSMPVVTGELQMHAIGCYSVCGGLKRAIRDAELTVIDAGHLLNKSDPRATQAESRDINAAWQIICFNQFHDILPGSSVTEAVEIAKAQIGAARTYVDRAVHSLLRTHMRRGADADLKGHRIHAVNRAPRPWSGMGDLEVWLDWQAWNHHLEDAAGHPIPFQMAQPASLMFEGGINPIPRVIFPLSLLSLEHRTLRIMPGPQPAVPLAGATPAFANGILDNGLLAVHFDAHGIARVADTATGLDLLAGPVELLCLDDESDTWSHSIDRYRWPMRHKGKFGAPLLVENGPLRTTVRLDGNIGMSLCKLLVSLDRNEKVVHASLSTNYQERLSVLKARIAPAVHGKTCRHHIAGGWVERPIEGREYPLHHAVHMETGNGGLSVVMPDTFAIDVTPEAIRPTLIRNSLNAYHSCGCINPGGKDAFNANVRVAERFGSDEGPQTIRFSIGFGDMAVEGSIVKLMDRFQRPPYLWDDFLGINRLTRFDVP